MYIMIEYIESKNGKFWMKIIFSLNDFFFIMRCGMQDIPQPGIQPIFHALGAQSLSHWTSREVSAFSQYKIYSQPKLPV